MAFMDLHKMYTLEDYRADVTRYIDDAAPKSRELIIITLHLVSLNYGPEAVNEIVQDFDLNRRFRIPLTKIRK